MIRVTSSADCPLMLNASVSGPAVYLDNWAIGDLAEGDPSRRRRFLAAMRSGIELLFSVTNYMELSGPQGRSRDAVRDFLDEIGPRWFPARLDPTEVIKAERLGESPSSVCISVDLLKAFVADRIRDHVPGSGKVIHPSDDFFRLGPILDAVAPHRESISRSSAEFDIVLRNKMSRCRESASRDPMWLDKKLPWIRFNPARPAFFVYWNLLRVMSVDAASLKKGDGLDFCHTVMACAFASLAALDKHWKRRVAHLPKPNRLARVYSRPELDQMVIDMESWANGKTVQQECFAYIPSNTIASYLWDRRLVARENESDYFPAARSREPGLPESFSGS